MGKITFFYWILIMLSFVGCKDDVLTTTYPNGGTYEEYQYKGDSLKHGYYKAYSEDGKLLEEAIYQEGKLDGVRKVYNGDYVEVSETYDKNTMNGPFKLYYPDGTLKLEGEYNNGVLEGIVKGYYPSGALKEEVTFEDNMEQGPFREFHENGQIKWEGEYLNGDNEFGLLKEYNEEGILIKKMMCNKKSICTTTWSIENEEDFETNEE